MDGNNLVTSIGTGLLSGTETSLKPVEELRFSELTVATDEAKQLDSDRPFWWILALLAFGVLMFEWWYFQRARGAMV